MAWPKSLSREQGRKLLLNIISHAIRKRFPKEIPIAADGAADQVLHDLKWHGLGIYRKGRDSPDEPAKRPAVFDDPRLKKWPPLR